MTLLCMHRAMEDAMSGSSFDDHVHEQDRRSANAAYRLIITKHFPVAMRLGDTPVLIPNTMVKT